MSWSIFSARQVLYPERRLIPAPHPLPSYAAHDVTMPDGTCLDVWILERPSPRARILVCHGYYANRCQVLALAHGLRQRGYEVVLFELRGHGSRPGPCTLGVRECEDALGILQWARTRDPSAPLPIGMLGFSMGAAVACQVTARAPAVKALIADSLYSRFFPILKRAIWGRYHLSEAPWAWLTWWAVQLALHRRLTPLDPAALAPRLHQPLLVIQGGDDQQVIPPFGEEFYQRWAGPKERWVKPDVGHVGMFAHDPEEYCDRVARFFDRAFTS